MRCVSFALVAMLAAGGACSHEPLPWPPPPADLARINEAAEANRWLRVEYVQPLRAQPGVPLPVPGPIAIESIDDAQIGIRTRSGEVRFVPSPLVMGVTVKERGSGVALGALAGVAVGGLWIGGLWFLNTVLGGSGLPRGGLTAWDMCDHCVGRQVTVMLALPAVVGGVVGYFIQGRRTFDFGGVR